MILKCLEKDRNLRYQHASEIGKDFARLGSDPEPKTRRRRWLWTVPAATLLGSLIIFLITPFDLKWQLQTALGRVMVQVWPSLLLFAFAGLRTPESAAIPMQVTSPRTSRKAASRRA